MLLAGEFRQQSGVWTLAGGGHLQGVKAKSCSCQYQVVPCHVARIESRKTSLLRQQHATNWVQARDLAENIISALSKKAGQTETVTARRILLFQDVPSPKWCCCVQC